MAPQDRDHVRAAYDAVAKEYADRFSDELTHKPLDRELLARFAKSVRRNGVVYDLGCGPGHTTAFLHECGANVRGIDLSTELVRHARARYPHIAFDDADMLALPFPDRVAAGIASFYSIVHFEASERRLALDEMHRILAPDGHLLLAFHIGDEVVHVDEFLGKNVRLDFVFHPSDVVTAEMANIGFVDVVTVERDPYPDVEYPSRRAYVFARKRS